MPKLSANLPKGDADGLGPIARDLIEFPHRQHVVIAVVDCKGVTTDFDTGATVPTVRIRRIEVVDRADLPEAERLVRRALERRSGLIVLPLDLEDELTVAFKRIDPKTGELLDDEPVDTTPED
ncbi:hypothetical protein ACQPW1_39810 [Nocardia sp. CA-128927]|uniref:hypothetical protein n=1 Tax=Nocardia sp. CA-128927 TaxID=3239975 RepID=UPI003D951A77